MVRFGCKIAESDWFQWWKSSRKLSWVDKISRTWPTLSDLCWCDALPFGSLKHFQSFCPCQISQVVPEAKINQPAAVTENHPDVLLPLLFFQANLITILLLDSARSSTALESILCLLCHLSVVRSTHNAISTCEFGFRRSAPLASAVAPCRVT